METSILFEVFVFLAAACVVVPLVSRFKLGAVLGYLAAGVVIGPWGFGFITNSEEAVGRITMAAFPFVWLLANRRSIFARRAWPIVSTGLFTLVAILSFGGYWVP